MRDMTKVVIGFGSIWGLFSFASMLLSALSFGINDTFPEIIAVSLYGLTILPSCILAIWFYRPSAFWLIALSPISISGFMYQAFHMAGSSSTRVSALSPSSLAWIFIGAVPALIGYLILRSESREL